MARRCGRSAGRSISGSSSAAASAIDYWLDLGIDRIVLGTVALRDSALVRRAAGDYPDRVVVGIDARDGRVAVEGRAEFAQAVGRPVIASGGIASLADIRALAAHEADGIEGAICGRALYDGS